MKGGGVRQESNTIMNIIYRAEGALTVRGRGMWNLRLAVSAFSCLLLFVCSALWWPIARSRLKIAPRDLPYLQNNQKWYFKKFVFLFLVPWGTKHIDICDFSDQMLAANPRFEFEKVSGPPCLRRPNGMPCTAGSSYDPIRIVHIQRNWKIPPKPPVILLSSSTRFSSSCMILYSQGNKA